MNINVKLKSTNLNFITGTKSFHKQWKDGKFYDNIKIGCFKSSVQGTPIYNAVTGDKTPYYVGSRHEDLFFINTECSGLFGKEGVRLYYDTPEQYENHIYEFVPVHIKEMWHKKNLIARQHLK